MITAGKSAFDTNQTFDTKKGLNSCYLTEQKSTFDIPKLHKVSRLNVFSGKLFSHSKHLQGFSPEWCSGASCIYHCDQSLFHTPNTYSVSLLYGFLI